LLFVYNNGKPVCGTANLVYIPNFMQMGEKAVISDKLDSLTLEEWKAELT